MGYREEKEVVAESGSLDRYIEGEIRRPFALSAGRCRCGWS